MTYPTEITMPFADGDYRFFLPIPQMIELERVGHTMCSLEFRLRESIGLTLDGSTRQAWERSRGSIGPSQVQPAPLLSRPPVAAPRAPRGARAPAPPVERREARGAWSVGKFRARPDQAQGCRERGEEFTGRRPMMKAARWSVGALTPGLTTTSNRSAELWLACP